MYDKILVPLDGSKLAECVIPHVIKIATDCKVKEVILLRVCTPVSVLADYPTDMPDSWEEHVKRIDANSKRQCALYLDTVEEHLQQAGLKNVTVESRLGDPAKEIIEYINNNDIGLVIIASHGRSGPGRWAYGSVADKVFRSVCAPMMIIRGPGCVVGL